MASSRCKSAASYCRNLVSLARLAVAIGFSLVASMKAEVQQIGLDMIIDLSERDGARGGGCLFLEKKVSGAI